MICGVALVLIYAMLVSLILPKGESWKPLYYYVLPGVWALGFFMSRGAHAFLVNYSTKQPHKFSFYLGSILLFWDNRRFVEKMEHSGGLSRHNSNGSNDVSEIEV